MTGLLLWQTGAGAAPPALMPPLPVRLLAGTEVEVLQNLVNVRPVKGDGPVVLQLDLAHKRILDSQGRLVVESNGRNVIALQGTLDKWRYIGALRQLAASHPQEIHIDPLSIAAEQLAAPLPRLYSGHSVVYVVTGIPASRQVAVFNLDATGGIQLLYIQEGDSGKGDAVAIDAIVKPPFGVEHMIALSARDPARMHAVIGWLKETDDARGMLDTQGALLEQITALKDVRVGMVEVYTCQSAVQCRR